MSDPTPPPERPLPESARARIRAELVRHARENRSHAPRWVVPVGAAAAVALVAGLSWWAVDAGGSDQHGLPVTGGGTSSPPAAPTTAPTTEPSTVSETTATIGTPSVKPSDGGTQVGTGSCEAELVNVLPGAQQAFDASPDLSFWVKGDQFTLCYLVDGSTTLTRPQPLVHHIEKVDTYRVASLYPPTRDGYRTIRVAGGAVSPGVGAYGVVYTFPDGHTQQAQTATDQSGRTWWWMVHSSNGTGGNETRQPEIKVTASHGGFDYSFPLEWGVDTCAQANHGC